MADISSYIEKIQNAIYGEEVRGSIMNALEKVNDDNEKYLDIKKDVVASAGIVEDKADQFNKDFAQAKTTIEQLKSSTSTANTAKSNLDAITKTANTAATDLQNKTKAATTTADRADIINTVLLESTQEAIEACTQLEGNLINVLSTEQVENISIKEEVTGEVISLQDSADWRVKGVTLYGKSEQVTTTGAQLLNIPDSTKSLGGTITVICKDGEITLNGENTESYHLYFTSPCAIPANSEIYFALNNNSTNSALLIRLENSTGALINETIIKPTGLNSYVTTRLSEASNTFVIGIPSNSKVTNFKIKPMIALSKTPVPWEPYTGGKPSPSPEYPQEIASIGDRKNIFDISKILYGSVTSDGIITFSANVRDFYKYNFKVNTQYTLSAYVKNSSSLGNLRLRINYTDGTFAENALVNNTENYVYKTFTTAANKTIDKITTTYGYAGTMYIKDLMIVEGTVASTHAPYGCGALGVNVCGKNLLDVSRVSPVDGVTIDGTKVTVAGKGLCCDIFTGIAGVEHTIYNTEKNPYLVAGTYTFSANVYADYHLFAITENHEFNYKFRGRTIPFTFTITEPCYISIGPSGSTVTSGVTFTISDMMITTVGFDETRYTPYIGQQSLTVPLPEPLRGIPVSSGGNYTDTNGQEWICDTVEYKDGVAKIVRRIFYYSATGDEKNIDLSVSYPGAINLTQNVVTQNGNTYKLKDNIMCNILPHGKAKFGYCRVSEFSAMFWIKEGAFNNKEEASAFLKSYADEGRPLTFIAEINEIVEEPLTPEQFAALKTYYQYTTFYNDANADMSVTYVADPQIYIENKFKEIQNAIVSLGGNI